MPRLTRLVRTLALVGLGGATAAHGEDLGEAWGIALRVNQQLQAQQSQSVAAGLSVEAAKRSRLPTVRNYTFDTQLTNPPATKPAFVNNGLGNGGNGNGGGNNGGGQGNGNGGNAGGLAGIPSAFYTLGPRQRNLPVSLTNASLPLYTGGRLTGTIDQARHTLNAQKAEELRTALDLKLTVGEAYVAVLRARKNLETTRSNVDQLRSFARDVRNRLEQQLAIRSDDLAAQVSLSNAQLNEIQARTNLDTAWATYNRYLCRPLHVTVPLDELTAPLVDTAGLGEMADEAMRASTERGPLDSPEADDLTRRAITIRPELASLGEQARALAAQAVVTKSNIKPQASLNGGFIYIGADNFVPQGNGNLTFLLDWTITDSGATRRRTESVRQQERAALQRRSDQIASIALEVRTNWLNLQQSRLRVPVAQFAVTQAQENVKVITDRYRQQLATYTEVLDAENRRVQSLNQFYNAIYDENLAMLRLRRSVGDI